MRERNHFIEKLFLADEDIIHLAYVDEITSRLAWSDLLDAGALRKPAYVTGTRKVAVFQIVAPSRQDCLGTQVIGCQAIFF